MPLSAIEAQMVGLPVVAPNVGSVGEVVLDGVTGLVVHRSLHGFVASIGALVGSEKQIQSMSTSSVKQSREYFSKSRMVATHIEIYESAVTSKMNVS